MSYDYPVWEFEQKFTIAGGFANTRQYVKTRGSYRFVCNPWAPSTVDPSNIQSVGNVTVYKFDGTSWNQVFVILPELLLPAETQFSALRFGNAISVIVYEGTTHASSLVISSSRGTWAIRLDMVGTGGDWAQANTSNIHVEELRVAGPFTLTHVIDMPFTILYSNKRINIPLYYSNTPSDISYTDRTTTTPSAVKCSIVWDGNYAWAFRSQSSYTGSTRLIISAIDTWHYDGGPGFTTKEKLDIGQYFDNNTHSLTRTNVIDAQVNCNTNADIRAYYHDSTFYLFVGSNYIYTFDGSMTSTGVITAPAAPLSNIVVTAGNIFYTSTTITSTDQNLLHRYNLATKTWTSSVLPGRKQASARNIVDGLDGYVWVTNKNNHSIIKVDATNGDIVATIRINRHPYQLNVNQSKELYVASDPGAHKVMRKYYDPAAQGGLLSNNKGGSVANTTDVWRAVETLDVTDGQISLVNQTDNSQTAFCAGRVDSDSSLPTGQLFDDGQGYLWFIAPDAMGRLQKSDQDLKVTLKQNDASPTEAPANEMIPDNGTIDYTFENCIASIVTPLHTYQKWDGNQLVDTVVKPYLIWTADGSTFNAVRLSSLVRKSKYIHRATGMVATGQQAFIGD